MSDSPNSLLAASRLSSSAERNVSGVRAKQSIEETYRRCFPLLREKCRRMLGDSDEAQDVAQETFLRFLNSGIPLSAPDAAVRWMYRTSTHMAIDLIRRRRFVAAPSRETEDVIPQVPDVQRTPERKVASRQALAALSKLLSEQELEVTLLTRLDGMTQIEVGEVLGISERTVRRVLDRVQKRLNDSPELGLP